MMSKGQIMSEDFKGQLAERMPIAFRALEVATGKSSAELRKMMEMGQLGADVLPKFGLALSSIARQGGALEKVLNSARVTQARFVTQSQKGADTIFKSGFNEGISDFFKTLTEEIKDSEEGLEGLGKTYRLFFRAAESVTKVLVPLFSELFRIIGDVASVIEMAFGKQGLMIVSVFAAGVIAAFSPLILTVTTLIALLDELSALFIEGKIGLIEKAIGDDISSKTFADKGVTLGTVFPAIGLLQSGLDMLAPSTPEASSAAGKEPTQVTNQITVNEDGSGTSRQIIEQTLGMGMHVPA